MSEEKKQIRWLERSEAKKLGLELKKSELGRKNARYSITAEEWELVQRMRIEPRERAFQETQRKLDKHGNTISSTEKLQSEPIDVPEGFEVIKVSTSKTTGQQWVQYAAKKELDIEEVEKQIDFDAILSKHVSSKPPKLKKVKPSKYVDRLIYTDTHIGMTTNENGFSLYGGKWDEIEQEKRFNKIVEKVLEHKKSNIIYIDDLGDYLDGWDGETTRKGHKLPQNMDNEKAFDIGLKLKILLTDALSHHYEKVICHNICNDNHAGSFGYILNSAFKSISEHKYNNVEVINQRKFIDHYSVGKHCFILTHGKDDKALKFGFKPHLDHKQIEKISEFIRVNKIHSDYIEFSKGDSHQFLLDYASSDIFDYCNYGAVSPSSNWVQSNFKKGRSSFVIQHINPKENEKIVKPFYFNWDE